LAATVGKMENPFNFTWMVFDPDLTPEGGVLQGSYAINDKQSIAYTGGAFVLQDLKASTHDPFLYGGQIMWNAKWTDKWASALGVGAFAVVSPETLTTANALSINQGNTRNIFTTYPNGPTPVYVTGLQYNYTPLIADASVTYTLDSFPFYAGAFPVKLAGEAMHNPGAPRDNNAFWVGVTFGKSGTKKTWDISYRYEYLGADAWYDQMVDDDNGAYYAPSLVGSTTSNYSSGTAAAGWVGGTNIKGHLVRFNYSITDSLTFTVVCYINELINRPQQSSGPAVDLNSSAIHFYADFLWKF